MSGVEVELTDFDRICLDCLGVGCSYLGNVLKPLFAVDILSLSLLHGVHRISAVEVEFIEIKRHAIGKGDFVAHR